VLHAQQAAWLACRGRALHRTVQRFRGGLAFKAHSFVYHSTLGLRVIKKKKKVGNVSGQDVVHKLCGLAPYRGTSLIRNTLPPRITIGP